MALLIDSGQAVALNKTAMRMRTRAEAAALGGITVNVLEAFWRPFRPRFRSSKLSLNGPKFKAVLTVNAPLQKCFQ